MVYLGSALMIYNIYGFIRFALFVKKRESWTGKNVVLYIPIILLILFFLGYLGVGVFGKPDLLVAGILFGGSIFVFIMYLLLNRITNRMIENERLRAELLAVEESNRVKNEFLASMSHEMRTPMNVILGITSIARKNPDLPVETQEQFRKIEQSGAHLLQMINNILDLNDIETGKTEVKNDVFSMHELLRRVTEVAQEFCDYKGLELVTSVGEDLKEWYSGDMLLLEQVILPILNNAAKYTDAPGTVTFSVDGIDTVEGPQIIKITVEDTGIGIDEEFLPKIFEMFAKEDASATSKYGGSGIGLTATKSKVDLLGGTIEVRSTKNVGSVFTITLPLTAAEKPQEEADGSEISLEGRRILIVEDMAENAEIVADLLELEEAESEHAENGQIALDMFSASPAHYYDAVLMDLRMPVLDGLEAAKRIRALDHPDAKTVPILALTANAFESDVRHSLDAGMNAHLVKPVDADLLYASLKRYIKEADLIKEESGLKTE